MDIEQYINETAKKDPTWQQARLIVERRLSLPGNLPNLIRLGWAGMIEPAEFLKFLGFTSINPSCLVNAAGIPTDGRRPRAQNVEEAIQNLGIRYSSAILAVNTTVRNILKTKPALGWRKLLETMMTEIEIGYNFGIRAGEIGPEGGVIAAFAKNAGLGILLAHNISGYKKYIELNARHGKVGSKIIVELFGCEPYQVSALVVQKLGFGAEAAFGTAVGLGNLNTSRIELQEAVLFWRAAFRWIEALRVGRNYPADTKVRNFFPTLRPPKEHGAKNPTLEVLYTEVAKVRREGSTWTWHLPRPDYERVKQVYGI